MYKKQSIKLYKKLSNAKPFFLICGPCMIESEKITLNIAEKINNIKNTFNIPIIFKSSFDKANRTSGNSPRGVGIKEGLKILNYVKDNFDFDGVTTDVHDVNQVNDVANVCDILQIPAFLCRQTDLIVSAGDTGRIVNIKKGQFASANTMLNAQDKVIYNTSYNIYEKNMKNDNEKILNNPHLGVLLTERGTSFGYSDLIVDVRNLIKMRSFNNLIIQDISHANQEATGKDENNNMITKGNNNFIFPIARAAVAVGVDGLFIETHENSNVALSDNDTQIDIDDLKLLLDELIDIANVTKGGRRELQM